jgi:hypothetical protein
VRRLIILPAAARLVEALRIQAEDLPAEEAEVVRIAVVVAAAVVVVADHTAAVVVEAVEAEAAAAITRIQIAPRATRSRGHENWAL